MFECEVVQKEMLSALNKLKATANLNTKKNEDYTNCISMTIEKDKLLLSTTNNSEVSIVEVPFFTCTGTDKECSLVQYKTLKELVETIAEDKIIKISDDGKVKINYNAKRKPIVLQSIDRKKLAFPKAITNFNNSAAFKADIFKNGIEKVCNLIKENSSNEIFSCCSVCINDGKILIKGIDSVYSKRMALYYQQSEFIKGAAYFFPNAIRLKKIADLLDGDKGVLVKTNNNVVMIQQDNASYYLRLINGKFPQIEKFIIQNYYMTVKIQREGLITALKRIKIVAEQKLKIYSCTLNINNDKLIIKLNADKDSIEEEMNIITTGTVTSKAMSFNTDTLLDTLSQFKKDFVLLNVFTDASCVLSEIRTDGIVYKVAIPSVMNK